MNLFDEFFVIVRALDRAGIRYAVVGGIAMAFHDEPRLTRDVELLIHPDDVSRASGAFEPLGYLVATEPRLFPNTPLPLHHFMKTEGEDHLVVDVLCGTEIRHGEIVDAASDQPWSEGIVKVVRKEDLVWLKEQRGSDQDELEIRKLQDDKNRDDSSTGE